MMASEILERRARQVRSRLALRAWDYRQRHLARGVWFRLRRLLADAAAAYAIPEAEARRLLAEGFASEAVGAQLEPPKLMIFVPPARIHEIKGARELPLRLARELLEARQIALVRFPDPGAS
jgi:hypothetical protein